jgi:hypothetical protein
MKVLPHWLTGALAFLGLYYFTVRPLGIDEGASWLFAVSLATALGAWLKLAVSVTVLERSERAVTLRMERRPRRSLSLRRRLALGAVVSLVAVVTVTILGNVLAAHPSDVRASVPPRMNDSGKLPVISGPSGESRVEPRFSRAVALVAGIPAEVRCWSVTDWQKRRVEWGNWRGQELGPWGAYTTRYRSRVHLSPSICASLTRLVYEDVPVRDDPWVDGLAWSVGALAHEAQHVRGVLDERKAECFGVQSIATIAAALGRDGDEGRYLARLYWTSTYLAREPRYRSDECRDGGDLDLHPKTRVWP